MAKNFQLVHKICTTRCQSTNVFTAVSLTNREYYTVKITDLDDLTDPQVILNEISRTRHIRHNNILPLLNSFVQESQIWCIYPHIYYGSCRDILNAIQAYYTANSDQNLNTNNNNNIDRADEQIRLCFNEQSIQPIVRSILLALDYLHSKHIIHRCVCPENIYINQSGHVYLGGMGYAISLIDNGFLNKRLHEYPSKIDNYVNYLSPEILQQNLIGYNTKSDIYSLGVTICELANGIHPFIGCEKTQMLFEKLVGYDIGLWDRSILTTEICASENPKVIAQIQRRCFSEKFRNFVDLCVVKNHEFRANCHQLLHHTYMKKMKLQSCLSTFQISIISEGLVELQKKIKNKTIQNQSDFSQIVQKPTTPSKNINSWNFD
ncbi:unnamed protein product [Brachionus calyciflorus]|uniref:Protein kinase domain-containing protein n=1 Tax=Brachionus calyciflorus TaxID=104777 RepID=A0A813XYT7_9BILA|nr:unnamed protein product [Brachionus calyciflorus]